MNVEDLVKRFVRITYSIKTPIDHRKVTECLGISWIEFAGKLQMTNCLLTVIEQHQRIPKHPENHRISWRSNQCFLE